MLLPVHKNLPKVKVSIYIIIIFIKTNTSFSDLITNGQTCTATESYLLYITYCVQNLKSVSANNCWNACEKLDWIH